MELVGRANDYSIWRRDSTPDRIDVKQQCWSQSHYVQ